MPVVSMVILFASAHASSAAHCSLLALDSKKPCTLGRTFGCADGPNPSSMWIVGGCRGKFLCGEREVFCGVTAAFITEQTGQRRNCTCLLRTDPQASKAQLTHQPSALVPTQVSSQRLNNNVSLGSPRFVPMSFDELLSATFALWDVLDATMREYDPNTYATGYLREIQLRRMLQLARSCSGGGKRGQRCNYCEVGMNGGHSTVAMLLANPRLVAHVFDMMAWGYSPHVATLLKLRFGRRFILHQGDSHVNIGPWARSFRANGSSCQLLFVDGDHSERGSHMDVQDLQPVASAASTLVMDDISVGPGCVMKRLSRAGVLQVAETYGPFDAPSPHNPCMRGESGRRRRRPTCTPWGFAILKYLPRGLASADEWPKPKRPGANKGRKCKAWLPVTPAAAVQVR